MSDRPQPPPGPGRRRGPRPLLLHLALATLSSNGSPGVWPSLNDDWMRWIARLLPLPNAGPGAALPFEPPPIDRALIAGIAAYRRHPYVRALADPPVLWSEGDSRLLDYGGDGPPLLLVPSLINRFTVLDLAEGRSMARYLATAGLRVLLLDWGWPGPDERAMGLDALITGRLARAVDAIGEKPILAGYCMGGLLTLAAALARPETVAGLALLATPWDFHAGDAAIGRAVASLLETLEPLLALGNTLPVDTLQLLFSAGDPHGVGAKYRAFAAIDQDSPRARQFVALEDWLNDGVPLAAPVARECLRGWYVENQPMRGAWKIGGQVVDPARLTLPCFVAVPERDRIVPPESAIPLAAAIPGAVTHRLAAGHVGMVAGSTAETALWRPLAAWAIDISSRHRPAPPPGHPR